MKRPLCLLLCLLLCITLLCACGEKETAVSVTDTASHTDTPSPYDTVPVEEAPVISETDTVSPADISPADIQEETATVNSSAPDVFLLKDGTKKIYCMDSHTLKVKTGKAVKWKSSNSKIASVSGGKVTTHRAGTVRITATDKKGNTSWCDITVQKVAYITIDDWPNSNTSAILEVLKEKDVRATFFLCSQQKNHKLYKDIVDGGHTPGNHTSSHKTAHISRSAKSFYQSVRAEESFIKNVAGVTKPPKIVRFPTGTRNNSYKESRTDIIKLLHGKGYRIFDWTTDSGDTRTTDPKKVLKTVKACVDQDREIVLFHHKSHSAKVLGDVIDFLRSKGYELAPITSVTAEYCFRSK